MSENDREPTTKRERLAWSEGRLAFSRGLSRTCTQYRAIKTRAAWFAGWDHEARTSHRKTVTREQQEASNARVAEILRRLSRL